MKWAREYWPLSLLALYVILCLYMINIGKVEGLEPHRGAACDPHSGKIIDEVPAEALEATR